MIGNSYVIRGVVIVVLIGVVVYVSSLFLDRYRLDLFLEAAGLPVDVDEFKIVEKTYESHQFGASSQEVIEYKLPAAVSGTEWCGDFGFDVAALVLIEDSGERELGCKKTMQDDSGVTISYTLTSDRFFMRIVV